MPFTRFGHTWNDCSGCGKPPSVQLLDGVTLCKCETEFCTNNPGHYTSETNSAGPLLKHADGEIYGERAWAENAKLWNEWSNRKPTP